MIPTFGTDGVRGLYLDLSSQAEVEQASAGQFYLTADVAFRLGQALARVAQSIDGCADKQNCSLVIGIDSRPSGQNLANALAQGWLSVSVDLSVDYLGVVPTPLVSFAVKQRQACYGAVISASHNPVQYNGIKFFGSSGAKISRELEQSIIKQYQTLEPEHVKESTDGDDNKSLWFESNFIVADTNVQTEYIRSCILSAQSLFGAIDLTGCKIVLDCANGAAFQTSPTALQELGAKLVVINCDITAGIINDNAGSTHIEQLCQRVVAEQAQIGLAHDGDADRLLAVDETGQVVDGDAILYLCAKQLLKTNQLAHNTTVGTVMTNLGVIESFSAAGINFVATDVGDSNVYAQMRQHGHVLGGEQSGHIIFGDVSETGDGLLTALCLLGALLQQGWPSQSISDILGDYQLYPQVLINVPVADKTKTMASTTLGIAISAAEVELNTPPHKGRVLVRPSGTENLIRVLVEANSESVAQRLAKSIAQAIS